MLSDHLKHRPYAPAVSVARRRQSLLLAMGSAAVLSLAVLSCSAQPKPKATATAGTAQTGEAGAKKSSPAKPTENAKGVIEGKNAQEVAMDILAKRKETTSTQSPEKWHGIQYPQPPNGKWLTDKQGRQYFVKKFPRIEGRYRWANAEHTKVMLWHGLPLDLDHYDQHYFYGKIYKISPSDHAPLAYVPPTQKELAAAAASYPASTPTERRWKLEPFDKGLPRTGQWRNGFAIADMNGDGHPDIVTGPARKGPPVPSIFLGDGHGNWHPWTKATFPPAQYDYGDAAVADFNGDGHPDIALGIHLRGMLVLVGDGEGHFRTWSKGIQLVLPGHGKGLVFSTRRVGVVDWNGDGRPDLLALSEGPRGIAMHVYPTQYGPVVYLNQGDGSWVQVHQPANSPDIFGDDLAVADFNGDGKPDFAAALSVEGYKKLLYLGNDQGKFEGTSIPALRPKSWELGVAVADFNGDGRPDLAVAYSNYQYAIRRFGIDLLLNRKGKDGAIDWQRLGVTAGLAKKQEPMFTAIAAGDLDGDGRPDIVALTRNGEVWVFRNRGGGNMVREDLPTLDHPASDCRGYHVALSDLDGDGTDEIVAEFAGETCPGGGAIRAWKVLPR